MRQGLLGWRFVGVLAALAIAALSVLAVTDHQRKIRAMERAHIAEWFCLHTGERCDERQADAVEGAWETRELAYAAVAVGLLLIGGVAVVAVRRLEGQRRPVGRVRGSKRREVV